MSTEDSGRSGAKIRPSPRAELELVREVGRRLEEAKRMAEALGEVVGEVSRYEQVEMGTPSKIIVSFDPASYFKHKRLLAAVGHYIGIVDVGTLEVVSAQITSVMRVDAMASISSEARNTPISLGPAPHGLVGKPQASIEPLLAFKVEQGELREGKAARYVVEPQSPAVLPRPDVLEQMLALPREGPVFGALTVGEEVIEYMGEVAKVKLPMEALLFHMLILGTTGSGKTTFIKNLVQDLVSQEVSGLKPVVCIVDCNGDYTQMIFPSDCLEEDELAEKLYGQPNLPRRVKVILPATRELVKDVHDLRGLAEKYYKRAFGWMVKLLKRKMGLEVRAGFSEIREPVSAGTIIMRILGRDGQEIHEVEVLVVPYAFKFSELREKVKNLSPYFTGQAREFLGRLLDYAERKAGDGALTTLKD